MLKHEKVWKHSPKHKRATIVKHTKDQMKYVYKNNEYNLHLNTLKFKTGKQWQTKSLSSRAYVAHKHA